MHWMLWIVVGWLALNALVMVSNVGKPRAPIAPGQAAGSLVVVGAAIALIVVGGLL